MSEFPIAKELQRIAAGQDLRFYMPGHKGCPAEECLVGALHPYDVTEISTTDNLYHAEGIIQNSQEETARIFGCGQAFYCTNGSTGALHTMLLMIKQRGGRLLVDRNCHKSVLHGAMMFQLQVDFLLPLLLEEFGITGGYRASQVEEALSKGQYDGVLITSPTYYGAISDIQGIAPICHAHGAWLLVDGAHGAHLGFDEESPLPPWKLGADLVAVSAHKTLPALTQTAYLFAAAHVDGSEVQRCMSVTNSSSPSYLMMASLEYAARFMEKEGASRTAALRKNCKTTIQRINATGRCCALGEDITEKHGFLWDFTRIILNTRKILLSGYELYDILEVNHMVCEMADRENVVVLPSVMTQEKELNRLAEFLEQQQFSLARQEGEKNPILHLPPRAMPLWQAFYSPWEEVPVEQAQGRVSAETKGIYPPGVCMLAPGEVIDEAMQHWLQQTFPGMIKVVKQ